MTKIATGVEEFRDLPAKDFCFIESFDFSRVFEGDEDTPGNKLRIVLRPFNPGDERRLELLCVNVQELSVGQLDSQLSVFARIYDVRDQQLEGLRYRVVDEEEGLFSFWCGTLSAAIFPTKRQSVRHCITVALLMSPILLPTLSADSPPFEVTVRFFALVYSTHLLAGAAVTFFKMVPTWADRQTGD